MGQNMIDYKIQGKNAVVCGSSRGLGRACATALSFAGATVYINGRDATQLAKTADEIHALTGGNIVATVADVTTDEGRNALLEHCPEPDILVTNAAGPPFRNFQALDADAIEAGLRVNMVSPILLIKQVLPGMVARKFGRIVNITSLSVKMPMTGLDLSSGARAGLTAFLAGVAREVAHANVTINNLLPGNIDTERLQSAMTAWAAQQECSEETFIREKLKSIPAARFGRPDEFGDACAFLCSANAGYITGQNLVIDGGLYPSAF